MSEPAHPPTEARHPVPLDVDYSVTPTATGSLVSVSVTNETDVALWITVANELSAPVSPPRTEGVPEEGWSREGFEGVVSAGETRSLGYACAASPVEPPVSVEVGGRPPEHSDPPSAEAVVRELGSVGPPRDALPTPDERDFREPLRVSEARPDTDAEVADDAESGVEAAGDAGSDVGVADVDQWLDAVEARVDRGERLTGASVTVAADVVAEAGGVDPCCRLRERLADDADALRRVAARARRLAERADGADVPADALRRLS